MSLNCEPTELTPLRRSNCSHEQQQHYKPEQIKNGGGDDDSHDGGGDHNNYNHELHLGNCSSSRFRTTITLAPDSALALEHLQSPAFSEYMSINSSNNNNNHHHHPAVGGSDTSRADTSEPNSQQALNPKPYTMSDTKRIITRATIDFIVLLAVGLPILGLFLWGSPYKRGFFCDDESLKHPFHDSTVRSWMLYIIGLVLPGGLICGTEIIQSRLNKAPPKIKLQIFGRSIPTWMANVYRQIGIFAFGAAAQQLTTDIAKYTIGRLRPHFFSVCNPIMPDEYGIYATNCSHPMNFGRYIEDFRCLEDSGNRLLKEMRLSFPSGHSSFSMYTMLYCAIYLQTRMTWKGSKLFKHFLQYILLAMTWFTCMSRVSDYKHHWSDVLAGALIGATFAIVVARYIGEFGYQKQQNNNCSGTIRLDKLGTHGPHTTTNNGTINV